MQNNCNFDKASINVVIMQTDIVWENPQTNYEQYEAKLENLSTEFDLVVLPEMFATGFTMDVMLQSETFGGATMQWMHKMALKFNAVIAGSVIIAENGGFYNRFIWMPPNSEPRFYDKRHLFPLAGENHSFTKGAQRIVAAIGDWRFCPQICYDLRFPVWSRNRGDYHVLVYVANWPTPRIHHWEALLLARAIENQCYVVGVNRIGSDGNNYDYNGHSLVVDYSGNIINKMVSNLENIEVVTLNLPELLAYRERFPYLADGDRFSF